MFRAVYLQLRHILFSFDDRGWYTVLLMDSCTGNAYVLLVAVMYRAGRHGRVVQRYISLVI